MPRTTPRGAAPRRGTESRAAHPAPAEAVAAPSLAAAPAVTGALVLLVIARALAARDPAMTFWGLHVQRFLPGALAWGGWALMAAALAPPVGAAFARALTAFGRGAARAPWLAGGLVAAAVAGLVLAFPDRLYYVGDFMLRMGAVRGEESPQVLSPQAFPLDVLVHYALPLQAEAAGRMDAARAVLAIGALGAAALAVSAVAFARALRAGPAARVAAFAVATFGGYLCLYTGESKAFGEMVVAVMAFAAAGFATLNAAAGAMDGGTMAGSARGRRAAPAVVAAPPRGGGAVLAMGLCIASGMLFHRFALGLVPAWLVALAWWWRAHGARGARSLPALLGVTIPLAVLASLAPRIVDTVLRYDLGANLATPEARAAGGVLGATFDRGHLRDVLNLVLFLSPLAVVAPFALMTARGRSRAEPDQAAAPARVVGVAATAGTRGEAAFLTALVVPFALVMLAARPPQGPLRDWDSFATPAAALSVWAAWALARAIDRARAPWLALAVALAAFVPALQWLAHFSDAPRGRARLEALMTGPPPRTAIDRARTWDFLGWRYFKDRDYDASSRAFERASDAAPSPSNLTHWGMAETMAGRPSRALGIYDQAAARDSNYVLAWFGVGVSAINTHDVAAAANAARALTRLAPENPKTREIAEWVARNALR